MTSIKKRVLLVTGFNYFPQSVGGAESSTHELCRILQNNQFEVAVLAALAPQKDIIHYKNRLLHKLTGRYAPADKFASYQVYRGWDSVEGLAEVKQRFKPDLVVVQSGQPAKLVNASINLGLTTILYIRDVAFDTHGGKYTKNDKLSVIANSQFSAATFLSTFGIPSTVIPPTIIAESYQATKQVGANKVLFINPHPNKGSAVALALAKHNPDIEFLFVEAWILEPQVQKAMSTELNGLHNVTYIKKQKDMRNVYAQGKVLF